MINIIFVCHGNICRSPMAEYIFKYLIKKKGIENEFSVSSAAVSTEETGSDIYPPAKRVLYKNNIPFSRHYAHKITPEEYEKADIVIVMDSLNVSLINRITDNDYLKKTKKLGDYFENHKDISDPWYTDNFDLCFSDILYCCEKLLDEIIIKKGQ